MPVLRPVQAKKDEPVEKPDILDNEPIVEPDQPAVIEEPDEPEDASAALQKQIDALKKSEEIQRTRADRAVHERDQAVQSTRERDTEAVKLRKESFQSQYDAVATALSAATAEAESAKRDIKTAIGNGDADAQTDAYERLAIARSNISKLEDGKYEIEARIKSTPMQETAPQSKPNDPLANSPLPDTAKTWLREHPEYLTNNRKNSKIQALHWDVVDEGHEPFSPAYFESLETHLGMRQTAPDNDDAPVQRIQQPQQRNSIVSAPVSREAPSTPNQNRGGQIRLTPAQREAAKIAGVSEADYGLQLKKLNEMRANGTYGDRQ